MLALCSQAGSEREVGAMSGGSGQGFLRNVGCWWEGRRPCEEGEADNKRRNECGFAGGCDTDEGDAPLPTAPSVYT